MKKDYMKMVKTGVNVLTGVYKTVRELLIVFLIVKALTLLPMIQFNEEIALMFNKAWVESQQQEKPYEEPTLPNTKDNISTQPHYY